MFGLGRRAEVAAREREPQLVHALACGWAWAWGGPIASLASRGPLSMRVDAYARVIYDEIHFVFVPSRHCARGLVKAVASATGRSGAPFRLYIATGDLATGECLLVGLFEWLAYGHFLRATRALINCRN